MRICLINDTSSCHAGSVKVMDNIKHYLKHHEIVSVVNVCVSGKIDKQIIRDCDWVVINGEGTIHHNAPWGIELLYALEYGRSIGKTTFLLNTHYEKMDNKFNNILKGIDHIVARDPWSYKELVKHNTDTLLAPDFCVLNHVESDKPRQLRIPKAKTQTHPASIYNQCFDCCAVPIMSIGLETSFDKYRKI